MKTKQIGGKTMTLHSVENFTVTVQLEGEKKRKRKLLETSKGFGFTFKGTFWLLGYDFNLKVDASGNLAPLKEEAIELDKLPFFVYGTLRQGMWNHRLFGNSLHKVVPAKTSGLMYHNGNYPYLFEGEGTARGELMYVEPQFYNQILRELDRLEGYRAGDESYNHYNRKVVTAILPSGEEVKAWAYFANVNRYGHKTLEQFIDRTGLVKIKDGDYVRWYNEYRNGGAYRHSNRAVIHD